MKKEKLSGLERVYERGIELLDMYYSSIPEKPKKRIYKHTKVRKCAFRDCNETFVGSGGLKYCKKHTGIMALEAKRRGWKKQNEKRSLLLKLSKKNSPL